MHSPLILESKTKARGKGEAASGTSPFFTLAPLAGVSDLPFREICFAHGADGATTEMVSAQALYYENERTNQLLEKGEEGPLVLQLFGKDPTILSRVIRTRFDQDERFEAIELNMGCPAPKIVKNGEGSALMRTPALAQDILRAMVESTEKPVHVKIRLGWDDQSINYLEIAQRAEEAGVSQITLHARTREQGYSGQADWTHIARLCQTVSVPVVGNGDVKSPEDAARMLEETGCAGITIGRGAMGNPFLFEQIHQARETGHYTKPTLQEVCETLLVHYKKEIALRGEGRALLEMRKHIGWYISGYYGAAKTKQRIMTAQTGVEVFAALDDFVQMAQDHSDAEKNA